MEPASHPLGIQSQQAWSHLPRSERIQLQCDLLGMRCSHRPERSEEHTSELQSQSNLVCRLLLEKKKTHSPRNASSYINAYHRTRSPLLPHDRFAASSAYQSDLSARAAVTPLLTLGRALHTPLPT